MAVYYCINAGGVWTAGATWSTISAKDVTRVGGAIAPTSSDDCIIDDYSGSVTVSSNGVGKSANFTSHTGTLTINNAITLTLSGAFTAGASMATASTGTLILQTTTTHNLNNATLAGITVRFGGSSQTHTLGSGGTINNLLSSGTTVVTLAMGSNNLTVTGTTTITTALTTTGTGVISGTTLSHAAVNFTIPAGQNHIFSGVYTPSGNAIIQTGGIQCAGINNGANTITGTGKITLTGGTWTGGAGNVTINLDIAGNCTLSGNIHYLTKTLTYVSGTVTQSSLNLYLEGSCTLNLGAFKPDAMTVDATTTATLTSALSTASLTVSNALTTSGAYSVTADSIYINGVILTIPQGQTLHTNTMLKISGLYNGVQGIQSGTASSPIYLHYTGNVANIQIAYATLIDVDATTSSFTINNVFNITKTRCTNIMNANYQNFTDSQITTIMANLNAPVGSIPTTPLLTGDTRLNNLDGKVSDAIKAAKNAQVM